MNHADEKLSRFRSELRKRNVDAYIIPSADPHLGEYITDQWKIIPWLTGFTGSAATVIITDTYAGLWTDSRYFVQAEKQLYETEFKLIKIGNSAYSDYTHWIAENLKAGSIIGMDGRTFSINQQRKIERIALSKKLSINSDCEIISELWNDRPAISSDNAFDHPVEFSGKDRARKIAEIRSQMKKMNIDYHLLTSPEDIMWMLNIRGNDIKYMPVLLSFAIIGEDQVLLFADENKIPYTLAGNFDELGIVLLPYQEIDVLITALPPDKSILIDPSKTSGSLYRSIPSGMKVSEDTSIPAKLKSVKNKVELENISRVMISDGVALTRFFFWLDQQSFEDDLTEMQLADKIHELRSLNADFLGDSFSAIVAFGENGALPHYSAKSGTNSVIGKNNLLLIDSGGQYINGTTDNTRTLSTGMVTDRQRKDFTLVLKGMISLTLAKFPSGTKGYQLDILARKPLWENGLNYGHGTGHGVGFCLNVHEGPLSIGQVANIGSKITLEPGMLLSNEPAVYREGEYGIRIENLIVCYEDEETEFGKFLKFYTATLCYIDKSLIDKTLLNDEEVDWLNSYHSDVYDKLNDRLSDTEKLWLKDKTDPL